MEIKYDRIPYWRTLTESDPTYPALDSPLILLLMLSMADNSHIPRSIVFSVILNKHSDRTHLLGCINTININDRVFKLVHSSRSAA